MAARKTSLDALEERHATASGAYQNVLRGKARALAIALGEPIPAWAEIREGARSWGGYQLRAGEPPAVAIDTEIPDELRRWARKNNAVIQVGQRGCVVYPFQKPARCFPSAQVAARVLGAA